MQNRIFGCIRPQVWSAAFDLKDPYFHVSILPHHRRFLRFAFEGRAYHYKVLPFRLSLSPCVFTKVAEAALVPLREQGVRILNYLDDWLILAQSQDQLYEHRDLVLSHLSQLGLRVNWEKSKLLPMQRISFLGMEFGFAETRSVGVERRLTASCFTPWPKEHSARTHWHTAGRGAFASMHFPQWAFSHRHCASRFNPPRPPSIPSWDLSLVLRALQQGPFDPCKQSSWSFSQNKNSTPACTNLHQEGWGPACIFCRRFVPKVWTGGFPDNPEAPARLCAQGFHLSLRGPSGEPASAAPGGGRPSPSFACPVRALTCYVDRTRSFRTSDQLLSVTEAGRKGMPPPSRGWPTR